MCGYSRQGGALVLAGAVLLLAVSMACGQLTAEDIAKLREQGQREGWTFTIGENEATRRPVHELCGSREPPGWRARAHFDACMPMGPLPPTFDWRTVPGFPAIRDQDGCGSCWAFAATGAVECAILITHGLSLDLAEQYLVSCTNAGDCGGGWGPEAYEFLRCNGRQDPCGGNGLVLESDFPYVAWNAPCGCPYDQPGCIDFWRAVGPEWGMPSVDQIKQAILAHGPVSASVACNNAFFAYGGGVFNANTDAPVDHDIVLVGWDDNQGANGVWILRNSWGSWWGDQGYMWIEYGCSSIGYGACYVDFTLPDCNSNGIRDVQDIADGTSLDCNRNGVPDECDLAAGTSPDCNQNSSPDECDTALPLPAIVSDLGPVLGWVEISGSGVPLNLGYNEIAAEVTLPFTSALVRVGPVLVGNDGAIGFGGPPWLYHNTTIPAAGLFGGELSLVPFWDDLGAGTGNVYWATIGSPPERVFLVEWYERSYMYGYDDGITFQVQVFEAAPGGVLAQYLYLDTVFGDPAHDNGATASIGFQLDGANGWQWSYYQPGAVDPSTVLSVVVAGLPNSPDVNHNGIPDACEPDCNGNGVPDDWDIMIGTSTDVNNNGLPDECESVGDLNCDGVTNFGDINPFVKYLTDFASWQAVYPGCDPLAGDINGDGTYGQASFADINPFVALLTGL